MARKIVWVMVVTFFGVFSVIGYLDARHSVTDYHAHSAQELALTAHLLGAALAEVEAVEGHERALQLLARANKDDSPTALRYRWVDDITRSTDVRLSEAQRGALARGEEVSLESAVQDRVYLYIPVAKAGVIEASLGLTPRRQVVTRVVLSRLGLGAIAVIAAAGLAILAAFWIVGVPMRELTHHARQIGAGDYTRRLATNRRDEIGALSAEMNAMCEHIEQAHERIRAEAEAKVKVQQQLLHADRMATVGTLAAGIAHELGTPLGVIAGRATMISAAAVPPTVAQYAEVISSQVERMTKITRGLLGFARRSSTMKASTDLRDVTKRTLELLGPLAQKQTVSLELASDAKAIWASVDSGQVEQAIANVVMNAIQAMTRPGTVRANVELVRATAPGERTVREFARITIEDTGTGIRPEDMPHIFEPFFTTKQVGGGTGLGLSVTYGIVHDHGGFIDIKSDVDVGTTVALHFPV